MKRIAVIAVLIFGLAFNAYARGGGGGGGGGGHAGGGFGRAPGVAHGPAFHGWHGGGWQGGGWHGHHRGFGPSVFIGGSFFYPWYYPAYPYYSYPAYAYPYGYAYPYPPPDDSEWEAGPPASSGEDQQDDDSAYADARVASYGLVQLRGVPDGATVDLDGREWLHADGLDQRWMALPEGEHVITVRVERRSPQERRIVVKAGSSQTVRFGSSR